MTMKLWHKDPETSKYLLTFDPFVDSSGSTRKIRTIMATIGSCSASQWSVEHGPLTVVVVGLNSSRGALATPGPSLELQLRLWKQSGFTSNYNRERAGRTKKNQWWAQGLANSRQPPRQTEHNHWQAPSHDGVASTKEAARMSCEAEVRIYGSPRCLPSNFGHQSAPQVFVLHVSSRRRGTTEESDISASDS